MWPDSAVGAGLRLRVEEHRIGCYEADRTKWQQAGSSGAWQRRPARDERDLAMATALGCLLDPIMAPPSHIREL
jgi:hypothetical protein